MKRIKRSPEIIEIENLVYKLEQLTDLENVFKLWKDPIEKKELKLSFHEKVEREKKGYRLGI